MQPTRSIVVSAAAGLAAGLLDVHLVARVRRVILGVAVDFEGTTQCRDLDLLVVRSGIDEDGLGRCGALAQRINRLLDLFPY